MKSASIVRWCTNCAIGLFTQPIEDSKIARGEMKQMLIHLIRYDGTMTARGVSSKLNARSSAFFTTRATRKPARGSQRTATRSASARASTFITSVFNRLHLFCRIHAGVCPPLPT
ncbi:hypothetical protein SB861_42710 [Paraburkholderia sp. SIMBA_049]